MMHTLTAVMAMQPSMLSVALIATLLLATSHGVTAAMHAKDMTRCYHNFEVAHGCARFWPNSQTFASNSSVKDQDGPRVILVTMFKDLSTLDLVRFIEYHILLGAQHLVLIDNNCFPTPALTKALDDYTRLGLVTYEERFRCWTVTNRSAHESVNIRRVAAEHVALPGDYVLELDDDEMVVLANPQLNLRDLALHMAENDVCSMRLEWRVFGTSGHLCQPPGGSLGNFVHKVEYTPRAAEYPGKTIYRWGPRTRAQCGRHVCPPEACASLATPPSGGFSCTAQGTKIDVREADESSAVAMPLVADPPLKDGCRRAVTTQRHQLKRPDFVRELPLIGTNFWDICEEYEHFVHKAVLARAAVENEVEEIAWINHYLFQSEQYWAEKRKRGRADNLSSASPVPADLDPKVSHLKREERDDEGFRMLVMRVALLQDAQLRNCVYKLFLVIFEERRLRL